MAPTRRKVRLTPRDLEQIAKTQGAAAKIVKEHLAQPLEDLKGYSRPEVATALSMLAYEALRANRTPEKASEAFDLIAHFAKRRIELSIKRRRRRLH